MSTLKAFHNFRVQDMTTRTKRKRKPQAFNLDWAIGSPRGPIAQAFDLEKSSVEVRACVLQAEDARLFAAWLIKFAEWAEERK